MKDQAGLTQGQWERARLFGAPGVYREGHFVLSSGLHSNVYFNKRAISDDPKWLRLAGYLLADLLWLSRPDVIVSPADGAIPFGAEVAKELARRDGREVGYVTALKDGEGGFWIEEGYLRSMEGETIAVVEDVFTTGESTARTLEALIGDGYNFAASVVAGLLDRSDGAAQALIGDVPLLALRTVDAHNWTVEQCKAEGPCSRGEEICVEPKIGHGDAFVAEYGQPPYK